MTTARPNLVALPTLEVPNEATTLFIVQDSAVNQTLTVQKARYLLNTIGPAGPTGPTGPTGASGYSGASGISGYSGASGISGWSGISGFSGLSGYSGRSGFSGYSGLSGFSGFSGRSGYSGISGASGFSGFSGNSTSGFSGYSGPVGATGPTGPGGIVSDLQGGSAGWIPIQEATDNTSFIPLGNVGNLLAVAVNNTATWVSTGTVYVNNAVNSDKIRVYNDTAAATRFITMVGGAGGNLADLRAPSDLTYNPSTTLLSTPKLTVTDATNATSKDTGALIVEGGVGIEKDLYVGGEIVAQKLTIEFTTVTTVLVTTDDIIRTTNSTNATSTNTGALQVAGGAGIGRDLYVGGTIYGTVATGSVNTSTLLVASANNIAGGAVGQLLFQTAVGDTDFVGVGTSGNVLVSRGSSASGPEFRSTLTLTTLSVGTGWYGGSSGEIRAAGEITAYFSDDRLKTRLGNIDNALAKVKNLNGFYYVPNETAQSLGYEVKKQVGISAQEVQSVLEEIVVPAPVNPEYLTVQYEKLIPLLVEAVKELAAEVEKLKKS